mgnify:CR=1 FL=1
MSPQIACALIDLGATRFETDDTSARKASATTLCLNADSQNVAGVNDVDDANPHSTSMCTSTGAVQGPLVHIESAAQRVACSSRKHSASSVC